MKKIILTGGSDGLGAAFGRLCLQHKIEIVCLSRSKPDYDACHIPTDLLSENSIQTAAQQIEAQHPTFDAVVHAAGVFSDEKPDAVSYAELERVLHTNLLAPAFLTSLLLQTVIQNGADILFTGSTVGTKAYPRQMAYGTSKWGLRGLTQNLQLELKNTPCRVIQFNPGGFQSRLVEKFTGATADLTDFMPPEALAKLMLQILELPKDVEVSEILVNRKSLGSVPPGGKRS